MNEKIIPRRTYSFAFIIAGIVIAAIGIALKIADITGGGALLYGIDRRIQDRTGIQVRIADDPTSCVAIGTGKALNELESLEGNSLNRRAPYL